MKPRIIATALTTAAVGIGLSACGSEDNPTTTTGSAASAAVGGATATATGTTTTTTTTTTVSDPTATASSVGVSGANTAAVVKAADAFLATLTDAQKKTILLTFGDTGVKTSWSNLPAALSPRKGIPLGSMTAKQQTAALALMKVVLSPQGYTELAQVRAADDYLEKAAAAKGGPGSTDYSSGNYYFAFYGAPSTTKQWLLQYTGHHLTHNVSYKGNKVTLGPTFEGVEPISFAKDGKTIAPLTDEAAGFASIGSALNSTQKKTATLSGSFDDLLLGAGNDGPFPTTPQGVKVSSLSQKAQDAVTKTIRTYVGDLDKTAADNLVKAYIADYDKTYFAYTGGSNTKTQGYYARIDGPEVWIEISTQHGIVLSGTHYHSIYREQGSDYGGS
jgi:hypothetical protein